MKKLLAVGSVIGVVLAIGVLSFRGDRNLETMKSPTPPDGTFSEIDRPRDVFERRGLAPDTDNTAGEDPVFFPNAKEADHSESASGEEYHQAKGDGKDHLSYTNGASGGLRGRSPGAYDAMGVGGGGGSAGRYGGRFGGHDTGGKVAAKPAAKPEPSDMRFQAHGTNPFIITKETNQSTFGLDVTTASYTLARTYLTRGKLPPMDAVRVEEFVNYFKYADVAPESETFAIHVEAAPSRFGRNLHLLRIAVKAKEIAKKQRMPATLTLVIDTSGSMASNGRLELVKEALAMLVKELGEGDLVAIVKYSDSAQVVLEHTADKQKMLGVIQALQPENSTNAEAGVRLGYQVAAKAFRKDTANRVILCSDGVANVGNTGPDSILKQISDDRAKGITLTCIGVGMNGYNDALLEQLATKGDGGYYYVDEIKEAKRVLVDNLVGTLQTVAMDAKVQVEFDPAVVTRHRLIGYEKRAMANEEFRNDKKDAGEIGAGHDVVALYEVELAEAKAADRLVKVSVRYGEPESKEVVEHTRGLAFGAVKKSFTDATIQFQLSAIVAEFAEILRKSDHAKENSLEGVQGEATRIAKALGGREDVKELVALVEAALKLWR